MCTAAAKIRERGYGDRGRKKGVTKKMIVNYMRKVGKRIQERK